MNERGFTLIEVLIVLFIMSILSVLSWQALDHVDRAKQRLDRSQTQINAIQAVLQQLEYDLQNHANLSLYLENRPALPFSANQPWELHGIHWEQTETVSTLSILQAIDQQWQWVQWTFKDQKLYRDEATAGIELPLAQSQPHFVALPAVHDFQIQAWIPARGWQTPPLLSQRRATGVEIQLTQQQNEQRFTYRKVVVLP